MKKFNLKQILSALCLVTLFVLGTTAVNAEDSDVLKGPDAKPSKKAGKGQMNGERKARGPGGKGAPMERLLQGIDLTEDQKTQIEKIKTEARENARAFFEANKDKIEALRAEAKAARESKDKEAFKALQEKRQELFKDAPRPGNIAEQLKAVLTEEQLKTVQSNLEQMKSEREKNRKASRGERPEKGERKQRGNKGGGDEKIDM